MHLRPLTVSVLAITSVALISSGCSESSRSGFAASTAAPVATSSTGAVSSTNAGVTPTQPSAPLSQGSGMDVFNEELQQVWDTVRPDLEAELQTQAQAQLAQTLYQRGAIEVEITNVQTVQSNIQVAPGITRFDLNQLAIRIPRQGTWELVVEADIRLRLQIAGSFAPSTRLPVKIRVYDISMELPVDFDQTDPTRPTITRAGQPQVTFRVQIDSTSSILNNATQVLSPIADLMAQQAVNKAMRAMLPALNGLQGMPGSIPGAGAPALADSGTPVAWDEIMVNIDRKLRRDNQPHGMILHAYMDTPATDSWEDAYSAGGPGNPGTVVAYDAGGDSAIFTGQYLAAQAFRYAAKGDSETLDNVGHTLGGIGKLLDVNGATGLLARNAAPQQSLAGQAFPRTFRTAQIGGQTWISRQGSKGISRDQYAGVIFGLYITRELVQVPGVQQECDYRLQMIFDYLIARNWIITEDRTSITSGTSRGPTFWAGIGYQKLTYLNMGYRINPAKYGPLLAQAGGLADTAWFGAWSGVLGNDHYYKFNLSHLAYYNFFKLETDMQRWQGLQRSFRIVRRFVGHHRNAHFDLIAASVDPSQRAVYHPQTREVMRGFLRRNHREVAPPGRRPVRRDLGDRDPDRLHQRLQRNRTHGRIDDHHDAVGAAGYRAASVYRPLPVAARPVHARHAQRGQPALGEARSRRGPSLLDGSPSRSVLVLRI
ncbi:hypothetical protein OAX78_02000 [Planctomycetota bacterium]|nr:hypothetical protein [Planctomycetota bacterium]